MQTLLIANRGEIARRVIRTARALGIRTVAVFTDLDAQAQHVREADDAYRIESYLDVEEIVGCAQDCRADAVHPGYGFLSERSAFARALEDAGITLVGPSAAVMDLMGRKDAAREVAIRAGVPVVPSYDAEADPATLEFPVLVKAAAGGGGKGMRVVRAPEELADAIAAARREARSAFGDDTMLIETYVESGRHVEVQVLGDAHGHVVHLFERDCSTQRRHQKVLEEAPAPTISDEQRAEITAAAAALAAEVGYVNAGTVEFLLDNATGRFYFLEMNTRLQVEHPVTEEVVRVRHRPVDLVALQLRVAAGEPLGFEQDEVTLRGHAIEARVYAEDSFGGFLPQAGTAALVQWPSAVRVDEALESGQVVSTAYDPMLGKVVAVGRDREEARRELVAALDETVILGLTTNAGFLRELVSSAEFADATIDTAWLDHHEVPPPDPTPAREIAAGAVFTSQRIEEGPFRSDGFRLGAAPAPAVVELDERVVVSFEARCARTSGTREARTSGTREARTSGTRVSRHWVEVAYRGQRFVFERPDPMTAHGTVVGEGTLTAPMPGTLLSVEVAEGDSVEAGQRLGVLEAMKMETTLRAPFDGTVTVVGAGAGDRVKLGAVLFEVVSTGSTGEGSDA